MAILWMAVLSLLLFWLPLLGPLLAGLVGGRIAGSPGRGLQAVLLPVIILCLILFVYSTALTGLPLVGIIFSVGLFTILIMQGLPLLLGALIGGLLA
ncbi:MAG TPA: hypothetical protein VK110_01640 [Salinisphaeraceae bacterium]|nr:hypothetical protein [Salinisphaeraceae bacterium]